MGSTLVLVVVLVVVFSGISLAIRYSDIEIHIFGPSGPTHAITPLSVTPAADILLPPTSTRVPWSPTPTSVLLASGSPEQAVRSYYQYINAGLYHEAWAMLSTRFRTEFTGCAPHAEYYECESYTEWWYGVAHANVGEVRLIEQSGDRAVVFAELSYLMADGSQVPDYRPYIELALDTATHMWLFYDKRSIP